MLDGDNVGVVFCCWLALSDDAISFCYVIALLFTVDCKAHCIFYTSIPHY